MWAALAHARGGSLRCVAAPPSSRRALTPPASPVPSLHHGGRPAWCESSGYGLLWRPERAPTPTRCSHPRLARGFRLWNAAPARADRSSASRIPMPPTARAGPSIAVSQPATPAPMRAAPPCGPPRSAPVHPYVSGSWRRLRRHRSRCRAPLGVRRAAIRSGPSAPRPSSPAGPAGVPRPQISAAAVPRPPVEHPPHTERSGALDHTPRSARLGADQMAGDHHALDLVGALDDL